MNRVNRAFRGFLHLLGIPQEAAEISTHFRNKAGTHVHGQLLLDVHKKSRIHFSYEDWGDGLHKPKWSLRSQWTNNPHPTLPGEPNLHDVELLTYSSTGRVFFTKEFRAAVKRHMELWNEVSQRS